MRFTTTISTILAILLVATSAAQAQTGFLYGTGASTIYVAKDDIGRVKDPLAVRFATTKNLIMYAEAKGAEVEAFTSSQVKDLVKGLSIRELFQRSVPNAGRFTLLEVTRFITIRERDAKFAFTYIETELLGPPNK